MIISSTTYQPITSVSPAGTSVSPSGENGKGQVISGTEDVSKKKQLVGEEKSASESKKKDSEKLSEEEKKKLKKLKQRDREVRRHEEAHMRAGGTLVKGGPQYEFVTGPDGKKYAVNGYVNIDVSPEKEPEQTVAKADRIVKAALAPAEPSSDDYAIASNARRMKARALQNIRTIEQQEQKEKMAKQAYSLGESLNTTSKSDEVDLQPSQTNNYVGANVTATA